MRQGYIKLYRKCLDTGIMRNHSVFILFLYCLLKATHRQYRAVVGNQQVDLKPGQFILGRRVAAEDTGLSEQQIRTALKFLKKHEMITSRSTNKYSIITVVNWDVYQATENKNNHQVNQDLTSNQPHTRTKEQNNNISVDLYEFYLQEISPAEKTRKRATENISKHLKKHSHEALKTAVSNYKRLALSRGASYRKNPANFFGIREKYFVDYLPENFESIEADKRTPEWL